MGVLAIVRPLMAETGEYGLEGQSTEQSEVVPLFRTVWAEKKGSEATPPGAKDPLIWGGLGGEGLRSDPTPPTPTPLG